MKLVSIPELRKIKYWRLRRNEHDPLIVNPNKSSINPDADIDDPTTLPNGN